MTKTVRTSGDYTLKAGDGFNSGAGTNTITLDSSLVSVAGNLTVAGTTTTVNTTNTVVADNIIELNSGISSSNNDAGIIIERGSTGDNAAIVWDESTDTFVLGTTTATGADKSGGITVTAGSLQIASLTLDGITITDNKVATNRSNDALQLAAIGTGDVEVDAGGDIILDADGADIKLQDDGTEFGRISRVSSDLVIKSMGTNNDILLKGLDGSDTITALTLDMSDAGAAIFNSKVTATDITANSLTTNVISSNGSNADININASGTGDVVLSALRVNGTTLDSADSTKITIAEAVDVTGTLFSRGNVFGVQTLTGSGSTEVVNLTDTVTLLVTTGSNQAFSLADGVEGQLKIISMKTDGGDGIVTPANFVNGTTITFNDVEDTVVLLYQSTGWVALARQNAAFA
tara:strand:+ start:578 stop:1792 length:1215 start_codon:yes stop_codon:yes gene_type:complete